MFLALNHLRRIVHQDDDLPTKLYGLVCHKALMYDVSRRLINGDRLDNRLIIYFPSFRMERICHQIELVG